MSKPEADAIREWLAREGYPLEYETAATFRAAGFQSFQALFYEDPETSDIRETDVSADEPEASRDPWRPVRISVECKNNSKPWLTLTSNFGLPKAYGARAVISNVPQSRRSSLVPAVASEAANFVLKLPPMHGHSVVQAFGGPDVAYAALQSATKSARASLSLLPDDQPGIALPLIVLGGSLYTLRFDEDGKEQIDAVPWARVLWHGVADTHSGVQVDVITRQYLSVYVESLRAATRALAEVLRVQAAAP